MTGKTNRSDALIRDIAKLFVTYPMATWRPIIEELETGGDVQVRVAGAISDILEAVSKSKPKNRQSGRAPLPRKKTSSQNAVLEKVSNPTFVPERAEALSLLRDELANRRTLPRLPDIRRLYLDVGGKLELPKDRKAACVVLLTHLNGVSDDTFSRALVSIRENAADAADAEPLDAYARWFRLIRQTDGAERQPELEMKRSASLELPLKSPAKKRLL